jgi:hypothetical protein
MSTQIPINISQGVELHPKGDGIASVLVKDTTAKKHLSWDRFIRLKAVSAAVLGIEANTILDAGGYDGALAFFLPERTIDLIDPATTGGCVLKIPANDASYDVVVAVDVLEHIEPTNRATALAEFARVARRHVILNYPCQDSKEAQELVLKLTNNQLIKEHVQWELPDSEWVLSELAKFGYSGTAKAYASIAIWLGQYVTMHLAPDAAIELNKHLVENYSDEPCSKALYHLLVCNRSD